MIKNYTDLTLEQKLDAQIHTLTDILKAYERLSNSDASYMWRAEALEEQLSILQDLKAGTDTSAAWNECYQEDIAEHKSKSK